MIVLVSTEEQETAVQEMLHGSNKEYAVRLVRPDRQGLQQIPGERAAKLVLQLATCTCLLKPNGAVAPGLKRLEKAVSMPTVATEVLRVLIDKRFASAALWQSALAMPRKMFAAHCSEAFPVAIAKAVLDAWISNKKSVETLHASVL